LCQQTELFEFLIKIGQAKIDADEDDGGGRANGLGNQTLVNEKDRITGAADSAGRPQASRRGSFIAFGLGQIHGAARDDGGDRMFVDHLRHGVAQQHNVLVKRLDLPLQLDSIDEVDGDWYMFPAQCVKKRVLK